MCINRMVTIVIFNNHHFAIDGKKVASNCDINFFSTSVILRTFAPSSDIGAKHTNTKFL